MSPVRKRLILLTLGMLTVLGGVGMVAKHWYSTYPTVPAVKLTADVPEGAPIPRNAVTITQVPVGALPDGALTSLDQVDGKYARSPMMSGDIVTSRRIGDKPPEDTSEIRPGTGLLSIPVNPAHVLGGSLNPGDVVTVFAVPKPETEGATTVSSVAAENVTVMDVRNSAAGATHGAKEGSGLGGISTGGNQAPAWVVLRVTPDEARLLMEAVESKAAIYFFLTARGDSM